MVKPRLAVSPAQLSPAVALAREGEKAGTAARAGGDPAG